MELYHIFCIHSSVEGYLDSLQLLAVINRDAMNNKEHVFLLHDGESYGYMSRSGITGSSSNIMPSFWRRHQTDFHSGFTSLQPHQQGRSVLSPHPLLHLFSPEILILAILRGVRQNLRIGLICIFLMTMVLNISLGSSQSFSIPQVKILYLALYHNFNRVIWFSGV